MDCWQLPQREYHSTANPAVEFQRSGCRGNQVRLIGRTISEVDNYGLSRCSRSAGKLTGSRLWPGASRQATARRLRRIEYTDGPIRQPRQSEAGYRLKQTDLDQSVHYSEAQQVAGLTSVREAAPLEFTALAELPEPVQSRPRRSPSREADRTGHAEAVLPCSDKEVATLFEGQAEAGQYYRLTLDGHRLASGVYLYRLVSGDKKDIKRLVLMK